MLGILLTFVALGSIALGLPSAVVLSSTGFGFLTLGAAALFLGGSLLGYAAGLTRARAGSR